MNSVASSNRGNITEKLPIKINLPEGFLDEEIRCDYLISKQMKEVWAVELDLLNELDRVCNNSGLTYFACAGTMLGAIRHKGIIPWDDDIDVMMLRDEYEKLCSLSSMFDKPYFFQTELTDKGSMRGHAQLRNSLTTGILKFDLPGKYSFNQGIFIDIFPIDNIPDETEERQKYFARLKRAKRNYMRIRDIPSHFGASKSTIKNALRSIVSPVLRFLDSRFSLSHKMCLAYEKECKKYISVKTQQASILTLAELGDRFTWDNKDLTGPTSRVPFEFLDLPLPNGYLKVLEKSYGNWKKPVKVGTNHGGVIFDCYKPYDEYLKER